MLWKLLLAIASVVISPFRGPVDPDHPYEVTSYGPQSWEEAIQAAHALHGEGDDILYLEGEPSYAGTKDTKLRWPGYPGGGTIPYVLDAAVQRDQKLVNLINNAIQQYHSNTCIRFVKRTNQAKYIKIIKDGRRCYSHVGSIPQLAAQPLSLGEGCEYIGTVVHELGHAVGLFHEHQRSDRDNYINVYRQNIQRGRHSNFEKTDAKKELKWSNYDYTSIMHYGNYAFSKQPGKLKTMEAKNGTPLKDPFERAGLNQVDIDLIRKLYKC